jgi:hypothetical protein
MVVNQTYTNEQLRYQATFVPMLLIGIGDSLLDPFQFPVVSAFFRSRPECSW